jgi:hypothetical protein
MDIKKIPDDSGKEFTRIFSDDKVESVNPIDYYRKHEIRKRSIIFRDLIHAKDPELASKLDMAFFEKEAEKNIEGFFEEKENEPINPNFITLLNTFKKKDQVKLLKGVTLNPDQLWVLIFKSYKDHGFLYSKYRFETLPKGTDKKTLPKLIELKDDETIKKVGKTNMTDGEIKNVINHRKVIVSHFFEKGENWHCIFLTYNSIAGKENHNNGQPHFHYISSGFGVSKQDFIKSMENGSYKSTSVHFDLLDYGKQPNIDKK